MITDKSLERKESKGAWIIAGIMTVAIIICGIAFFYKMFRFSQTLWEGGSGMLGFAVLPVSNYLFIAFGFFLLLIWAFLTGQFSDIEAAKYELLEDHRRYELEEQQRRQAERAGKKQ